MALGKYAISEVTKTVKTLTLDSNTWNTQYETETHKVIGSRMPSIPGGRFTYDGVGRYRFGCGSGYFTYKQLVDTISALSDEEAKTITVTGIKKPSDKPSKLITSPILDEKGDYYVCENGRAYAKSEYQKDTVTQIKKAHGVFNIVGGEYQYNGYSAGRDKKTILNAAIEAKFIIDFIEDKLPKEEIKVEETVAEVAQ